LQFALRELQRAYSSRRGLSVMAVVAGLLGIAGPFGTFTLRLGARIAYWGSIVFITYGIGLFFGMLVLYYLRPPLRTPPFSICIIGLVASLPIFIAVLALNWLFIGHDIGSPGAIALQWLYCFLAALGVSAVLVMAEKSADAKAAANAPAPASAAPEPPAILKRLPLAQRGRLLALSMQDHYVEVATDKGRALVLMRLSDAIAETTPVAGLQIHRSHWVALDTVARSGRSEGKGFVELLDGTRLPISRGYVDAARAAGLLS
jgi:hypothetical protein